MNAPKKIDLFKVHTHMLKKNKKQKKNNFLLMQLCFSCPQKLQAAPNSHAKRNSQRANTCDLVSFCVLLQVLKLVL